MMNIRYEDAILARTDNIRGRKLIVLGNDYLTQYVYRNAIQMGTYENCEKFDVVEQIIQSPNSVFVLVATYKEHKRYYEDLSARGFKYQEDFALMNIGGYSRAINAIDPLLGYTRKYKENVSFSEYDEIGNGDDLRIAVYGSSTTDLGASAQEGWPSFLYLLLKEEGIDSTIYNGAMAGYGISQCALKLFRDIDVIKPDMVIFMGG